MWKLKIKNYKSFSHSESSITGNNLEIIGDDDLEISQEEIPDESIPEKA